MLLIDAEVRQSGIAGKGLFAKESAVKGAVLALLTHSCPTMSEAEYQEAQSQGNEIIIMTAVRWTGNAFAYGDSIGPEEYINHSFSPTMLYHLGVCYALRDIAPGDELTADYRYFLAEQDVCRFTDSETGRLVDGYGPREAAVCSARELLRLLDPNSELCNPR